MPPTFPSFFVGSTRQLLRYLLWAWVLAVVLSLAWNLREEYRQMLERARIEARASFDKDILFRRWATKHGGVYVPLTADTPPNPYLKVPERDVVTTGGLALTLMNPAYITRQVFDLQDEQHGVRGHITSLTPLRPENAPDEWERAALVSFEQGVKEASARAAIDGGDFVRLMQPMITEQGCLKCHAQQGYKAGDIRGGISVAVPLAPYWRSLAPHLWTHVLAHLMLGGLGVGFLVVVGRRLETTWHARLQAERDLRTVEQRWHVALEAVGDGLWDWNVETDEVFFSDTWKAMLGYGPEELRNQADEWESRVHPDDLAEVMAAVRRHLAGETSSYVSEHRMRCKDGTYKWILDRGCVISRAPDGRALRMVGTHKDLTEARQTLIALSESEQRFATAFTDAPVGMAIRDIEDGRYIEVNRACLTMTGYARDDVIGKTPAEVGWAVAAADGENSRDPLLATGGVRDAELCLRRKDGRDIRCAYTNSVVQIGGRRCLLSTTIDITERRKAEQALRENQRLLLETQRVAGLGSYVLDIPAGRWTSSSVVDAVFGLAAQADHPVEDWLAIIHPADRAAMSDYFFHEVIGRGARFDREYRIVRRQDGAGRWVHGGGELEFDAEKRPVRMIGTIQDVTERRRAETAKALDTRTAQFLADLYASSLTVTDQELYDRVVESAVALTESAIGFLHRVAEDQETIILTTWNSGAKEHCTAGSETHYPLSQAGNWVDCVREKRPVIYNDFARSPHQRGLPEGHVAVRRFMSIPVLAAGKVQVIFGVGNKEADYDDADLPRLQLIATELQKVLERRVAEQARQAGEARFRRLFDGAVDAIYIHDPAGRIVDVNDEVSRQMGYSREELRRMNVGDIEVVVADPTRRELWARVLAGETVTVEGRHRRRDGTTFPVEVRVAVFSADGQSLIFASVRDITERHRARRELAERERQLQAMLDASPACVKLVARDGTLLSMNQAGLALLDSGPLESVLGGCVYEFIAPENRAAFRRMNERVCDGEKATLEFEIISRTGVRHWMETWAVPFHSDRHGGVVQLAVTSDVSARKADEFERRRLMRAVEQSPVTVVITDAQGTIEYVNPRFTRTTGYTFAEARGQNPRVLKSGVHSAAVYREMWAALSAGREWRGELCNRRKDGSLYWEDASISPVVDDAGRITHYLAVKEDITDRREAQERIREQATLLNLTRDAIIVIGLDGRVQFWNRGAEQIFEWTAEETMGRPLFDFVYDESRPAPHAARQAILETGEWAGELRHRTKAGATVVTRAYGRLVRDGDHVPHRILLTAADVTEAKRLESQFLRAQRMESLGSLASGVAHDLNNVLTPILVATELLKPIAREAHEREVVQLVGDSARRGAEVVQQLLLFGRGSDTPRTVVDPAAVAREVERMMRETFPRNIAIRSAIPKDLWSMEADRTQLHQVLLNLCVNARDAMPRGGELLLSALNTHVDEAFAARHLGAKPGPHVALGVADTGTGIPAAIVDKIFDPFFTTKPLGQGTGLGLATVLGITRSHGGFISVDTTEGDGARFTVFLPARQSAALQEATEAQWQQLSGHGELILLVDDEPTIRLVTEPALIKAGYRVVTAANGAEALAAFTRAAGEVRLVLSDVMMPVMDGPQLVHALRQLSPAMPIVLMSGLRDLSEDLEKRHGDRLRFIQKPFLIEAALRVVRELLDETSPAGGPAKP
ncbi:MAG: PAS domain S-box protein [Verrucomicrobia bacterium]|nr:PAS domain S-box protein [Verrucomicrobiota bacterium]